MINFGEFFPEIDESVNERKTWPPPGSADLLIEDEMDALFTSATWTVRARVNGNVMWESKSTDASHGDAFILQWSRFVIRRYNEKLRELGIDVDREYCRHGGKLEDLT